MGWKTNTQLNKLQVLIDDSVKGIMRSIGDPGDNPIGKTGYNALYFLYRCANILGNIRNRLQFPGDAYIFSTTPLNANETFISDTLDFHFSRLNHFYILAFADQDSAQDGLVIEESIDGENWDHIAGVSTVNANTGTVIEVVIHARYARVKFTNGGTTQSVFRLGGRYTI